MRGVLGTLLVFLLAAVFVRLGFWQLDRLEQRREHNAALAERLDAAPVQLLRVPRDTTGWIHRHVVLRGTWDADGIILYAGRNLGGVPGVHVLTPLRLAASGARVLVHRGWLPAPDGARPDLREVENDGVVRAKGIVVPFPAGRSPPPPEGWARADTPAFRRTWYSIDAEAIRRQYPYELGAVAVQLIPEEDAPRLPVRLPAPALDDGPHRGYAIQWFSFAVIALLGWAALVRQARSRTRGAGVR